MNTINLVSEIQIKYLPKKGKKPIGCITTSKQAHAYIHSLFNPDTIGLQEQVVVIYLNKASFVIGHYHCSKGGTSASIVDIKLIMAVALKCAASSIIISHNHPSGNLKPSNADKVLTTKLKEASRFFEMELMDHLIISASPDYYSFSDNLEIK